MGADGCRYPHKPAIGVKSSSYTREEQRSISLLNRPNPQNPLATLFDLTAQTPKIAKSDQEFRLCAV